MAWPWVHRCVARWVDDDGTKVRCDEFAVAANWCNVHRAQKSAGQSLGPRRQLSRPPGSVRAIVERGAVAVGDGPCIIVPPTARGHRAPTSVGGPSVFCSRVAWIIANGAPPEGMHVLHRCGATSGGHCVRVGHLYLGTDADNAADARADGAVVRGERHPRAKLSADDVRMIRRRHAAGESFSSIAADHGVARKTIASVVHRHTWRHVA